MTSAQMTFTVNDDMNAIFSVWTQWVYGIVKGRASEGEALPLREMVATTSHPPARNYTHFLSL